MSKTFIDYKIKYKYAFIISIYSVVGPPLHILMISIIILLDEWCSEIAAINYTSVLTTVFLLN